MARWPARVCDEFRDGDHQRSTAIEQPTKAGWRRVLVSVGWNTASHVYRPGLHQSDNLAKHFHKHFARQRRHLDYRLASDHLFAPLLSRGEEQLTRNQVAADDLYSFALPQLSKIQCPENVHYTQEGSEVLGKQVAASIEKFLPPRIISSGSSFMAGHALASLLDRFRVKTYGWQ